MTKTQKVLLTSAIIAAIVWLFSRAKSKAAPITQVGRKFKLKADWSVPRFEFSHPAWGTKKLVDTNAPEGQYNELFKNADYQLGWNRVPGNKLVVSLLHMNSTTFSEVYVIDLNASEATYTTELSEVMITA
jgi:hypothetical protein